MLNAQFETDKVKKVCEKKLKIQFRDAGEFNGWYELDGKKVARITVSKGRKYIPPGTYKSMATQLKLTVSQFDDLLKCPLMRPKFDEILKSQIVV